MKKSISNKSWIVGTVFETIFPLPETPIGTTGICYEVYKGGISVIFETGFYDGFSSHSYKGEMKSEQELCLKEIGFSKDSASYQFTNVSKLISDYNKNFFKFKEYEKNI